MSRSAVAPSPRRVLSGVTAALIAAPLFALVLAPSASAAPAVQSPTTCAAPAALTNGSFETPIVVGGVISPDQGDVPGWSTTASDGLIEIWSSDMGVPPGSGNQFAELNATQVSTLFQDLTTVPGQVLRWQLKHRGREGLDGMQVSLGPPGGPLISQGVMADDPSAWGTYSGLYTVPVGQTTTRFAFESLFSVGGASFGNFLDDVSLGTAACVILSKTVSNLTHPGSDAYTGDVLEYTVTASNQGGVPATNAVITDSVPAGATFVPGSIGGSGGSATDSPIDDYAEFVAGMVTARIGDGANASSGGSIPSGESRTLTFRATVDVGAVDLVLMNAAQLTYVEALSGSPGNATSDATSTPVLASADLQVTQTLDTPLAAGDGAQYTITVTNNGPQTSTGTDLTSTLPHLLGKSADNPDCLILGSQLVCHFGILAMGASEVVVVTGTVPSNATGPYKLVSSVEGDLFDPALANNTATTRGRLAELAASGSTADGGLWLASLLLIAGIGALGTTRMRRAATLD